MKFVLMAGLKGSGKNTVANFFQERLEQKGIRVRQVALADELRRLVSIMNPIVGVDAYEHLHLGLDGGGEYHYGPPELIRYNDAIGRLGYDVAKVEYPELRRILQVFGSDVARDEMDENVWVNTLTKTLHSKLMQASWDDRNNTVIIITDVRFPNETYELCAFAHEHDAPVHGMFVVREGLRSDGHQSERPDKAFSHPCLSDDGYFVYEYTIENNGTLDDLREYCYRLVDQDLAVNV